MLAMIGTRVRVLSKFTDAGLHWPGTIVDSEGRGEGFMYHVRLDGFGDKQTADFHGMRNIEGMAIVPPAEVSPL